MLRKIILLLLSLFLITGCKTKDEPVTNEIGCGTDLNQGCEISDVTPEVKEYRKLISSFKEITYDEAYKRITNGGSLIIYYGFETCPWCQELIEILAPYADKYEVFYVDMKPDGEDSRVEGHNEYTSYLKNYELINDFAETDKIYAPTLVEAFNSELVKVHTGTVEGHNAKERKMTDDEKELLEAVIEEFFKDMDGVKK